MPIKDQLVLVIGAGASKEVGLPIGSELTASIADALSFRVDDFQRLAGGDDQIRDCIYKLGRDGGRSNGNADDYYRAAKKIRAAMPLAPSIDNFIDSHRSDKCIAQVGKLAIAACILAAERASMLFVDQRNANNNLDLSRVKGTWFAELFSLLTQHCSKDELGYRFSRLTVISFNYDRCLNQFLRHALRTYYAMNVSMVEEAIEKILILRPYGSVGVLRAEGSGVGVDFGERPISADLLKASDAIRTFTESTVGPAEEAQAVRDAIAAAGTIVFLGFAFHPLNLELLYGTTPPTSGSRDCDVYATAMGISESNRSMISSDLTRMGGYSKRRVKLHHSLSAAGLISEYSRRLAGSVSRAA